MSAHLTSRYVSHIFRSNRVLFSLSSLKCRHGVGLIRFAHGTRPLHTGKISNAVFLMGSPGSGKTTVASIVGQRLGLPVINVDKFLEQHWKVSTSDKLSELGDEAFLAAEGEAMLQLNVPEQCIVSLSGSNPLHSSAMRHIHSLGSVVFLDVPNEDILGRQGSMKVDRIVGDRSNLAEILAYRQQFYEGTYDSRVICASAEKPESIADKVISAIQRLACAGNGYISTRSSRADSERSSFSEAILGSSAADGGLFVPANSLPYITEGELSRLSTLSYCDRSLRVLEMLIHPRDVPPLKLRSILKDVYVPEAFASKSACGIEQLGRMEYILELFNGPTASFKDLPARLLPYLFQHAIGDDSSHSLRRLVLVATSGDTGSAVAHSFASASGNSDVQVVVLYPVNGVTHIQKLQLLAACQSNVSVIGVDGDFDFCQSVVKRLLTDRQINRELQSKYNIQMSVANSINWGRLLGQIVYHVSGYLDLVQRHALPIGNEIDVCIPSGNFGNILAAFYAKQMGVPIRKLICASNCNNVLTELINTGYYNVLSRGTAAVRTISPAIDIVCASNVERYIHFASGHNGAEVCRAYRELEDNGRFQVSRQVREALRADFLADWCSDDTCLETIKKTYKQTGYLLDTHTAVGVAVANKFLDYRSSAPVVICATAHYAKCAADVLRAISGESQQHPAASDSPDGLLKQLEQQVETNTRPAMHAGLRDTISRAVGTPHTVLPAQFETIVAHIKTLLS